MGRVDTMTFDGLAESIRAGRHRHAARCLVVGVDGLSGSGKSSFAERLAGALGCPCIGTDQMVQGWDGLKASLDVLATGVLGPWERGAPARWRRFDWSAYRPSEWVSLPPPDVVVVEGCCVGVPPAGDHLGYLVWVDTPAEERRRRLHGREDWTAFAPFFDSWTAQESTLQEGARTAERADLIVDNRLATPTAWPDGRVVCRRAGGGATG